MSNLNQNDGGLRNMLFWASVVIWLAVFATFTLPGRSIQPTVDSLDSVALIKVFCRLLSVSTLGWIVLSHFRNGNVRSVVGCYTMWILFALWAIASTAWSPLKSISLGQAGGQVSLILLSVVVAMTAKAGEQKYLFQCLLALGIYSAIYGGGAFLFPSLFSVDRLSDDGVVHPTALGATASLGLVMATSLLLTSNWKWVKPMCFCLIPVFLIALMAAHNRLSVGLALAICVGLIISRGQSFRLAGCAIVMAVLGVAYLVVDPGLINIESLLGSSVDFMQRGQSVTELSDLSGRNEMWSKMWASYLESPLLGHGYFVCSSTGELYVWYTHSNHTAHNLALQALVSTGIIGFLLFMVWSLQIVRVFVLNTLQKTSSPQIASLAPAIIIWFSGWALLNASILGPVRPESAVYAMIIGLVIGQRFPRSPIGVLESLDEEAEPGAFE